MGLKKYAGKRDFTKTSEPRANAGRRGAGDSFVVQKHDASHLHYDFRLELKGVLKSWAVPKGPSLDPSVKRLAIEVEDHPVAYGSFEGTIPKGQYGGGTVMIWDRGSWTTSDPDPTAALRKGKLTFTLEGSKLRGEWTLTRLRRGDEKRPQWLLIKRRDAEARNDGESLLDTQPDSATSGRTLEEIAEGTRGKRSKRVSNDQRQEIRREGNNEKRPRRTKPAGGGHGADWRPFLAEMGKARQAPVPEKVSPQLCTLADHVPEGDNWLHEIKFDGYRLLCVKDGDRTTLITRTGLDWTARFPPLAKAIATLPIRTAIVDGEATIVDSAGRASFQQLQGAIKKQSFKSLVFFAFDLIYCEGFHIAAAPLIERKELLRRVLEKARDPMLRFSEHVAGQGHGIEAQACKIGLEGVVSKRADASYVQGRSRSWLKVKCGHRQEFVIAGYTAPTGSRSNFGALILSAHDGRGRLVYTGRVGTGFDSDTLDDIGRRLSMIKAAKSPLDVGPTAAERRGVHWVKPRLVAEVRFAEWTADRRLRQPSFQGLREDKKAEDVKIERASHPSGRSEEESPRDVDPPKRGRTNRGMPRRGKATGGAVVAGVTVTHPDRVVFADSEISKLDVARYYQAVAARMLPFLIHRPLSTLRCPGGVGDACFFQKHLGQTLPNPVRRIGVREKQGRADYIGVDSAAGLVTLVQFGVIELHAWGARGDDIEVPDTMTFDLDPADGVPFERVKIAALRVREELKRFGLRSFVKTSGGKGLHVVVPVTAAAGWEDFKGFAKGVASRLAEREPHEYIATMSKQKRTGRIFVDYLRNGRGATCVVPYSLRARTGAPISMPIRWEDLATLNSAAEFTLSNRSPGRGRAAAPWRGYFDVKQTLPDSRA